MFTFAAVNISLLHFCDHPDNGCCHWPKHVADFLCNIKLHSDLVYSRFLIRCMLNMQDITSNFPTDTVFIIADVQT